MSEWQSPKNIPLTIPGAFIDAVVDGREHKRVRVDCVSTGRISTIERVWPDRPAHLRNLDLFAVYIYGWDGEKLTLDAEDHWKYSEDQDDGARND